MENIYKVNDNKFKSIYISYNFTFETKKTEVSRNVVTSLILSKGCNKYKTSKEIEEYLSSLYGTNFDVNFEKIGDLYNIEFRLECVNKEFLPDNTDVVKSAVDFLYEILYNPKVEKNKFDINIFEREKNFVIDKINKRKDEKLKYAVLKTEELLCSQEPFGVYLYGDIKDAKNIKFEEIYTAYTDIINNSNISIVVSGNLNGYDDIDEYISNVFKDRLNSKKIDYSSINKTIEYRGKGDKVKEVKEKVQTNQSVITVGMRVDDVQDDDFYVLNVYNSILGGTPSSKLFQNVRERESLAYTAKSRYYRFKGIFVIYAGIEESNYEKAKTIILDQVDEIKKGNISEIELNSAKQSLINDILEWRDSKISLAKLEYTNFISDKNLTIDEIIKKIDEVKFEDVVKISKKINTELVYLLGGDATYE